VKSRVRTIASERSLRTVHTQTAGYAKRENSTEKIREIKEEEIEIEIWDLVERGLFCGKMQKSLN